MKKYNKNCPICNELIYFTRNEDRTVSIKNNAKCKSCANSGPNHPSYGKKLSVERREAISKRTSGSGNPNYGKTTPDHIKLLISQANKGRKPINIEKRKGKTLEEIYGEERAQSIREKYKNRPPHTPESNLKRSISCKKANTGLKNIGRKASIETRTKQRLAFIKRLEATTQKFHPPFNTKACDYFDKLMMETSTYIQHALNGGEYYIAELGFWVDGYDAVNNVVYEFDELRHHYIDGELLEKDKIRQNLITEKLGCKFIRIKETDI